MTRELWFRPWALVDLSRSRRRPLAPGDVEVPAGHRGPLWLYRPQGAGPVSLRADGVRVAPEPQSGFAVADQSRALDLLPMPLRHAPGISIAGANGESRLRWPSAPERPVGSGQRQTEEEAAARALLRRAEAVWDRLRDVEDALADPARLWEELRRRWTTPDLERPPQMDVIVRQSHALHRTLDMLDRRPRRILRRTHRRVPLARVQEVDRRAMQWLARQPGDTLAKRAGDDQRILAVARQESFDTLENRVLRAYAELATAVTREYLERNRARRLSDRARRVEDYGRQARRLARDLAARGVRRAEPGVTPNFVLQSNPAYHAVWTAWRELLDRERRRDELWRWQARSWEEFCGLALMAALSGIEGARPIATSPLTWRDEQLRGSWVAHDNPLGVMHLPARGLVVEVHVRMHRPDARLADFGAPIWLRIGRLDAAESFLTRVAVWPMWDVAGGLVEGEAAEIAGLLPLGARSQLRAGAVIRPTRVADAAAEATREGPVLALALGTDGTALAGGLSELSDWMQRILDEAER
tara:strand:- start:142 stop:1728 length:1587 start_codon:yes stop_codon:yes gene_type:complete